MLLKLSKIEIKTCLTLFSKDSPITVAELANELKIKQSFLSRVLKKLIEKDLIICKKIGREKYIQNSDKNHSQKLKDINNLRPNCNIGEWLSGYAIEVLVILLKPIEFNLLKIETVCSKSTLYSILNLLYSAGVINKNKDIIKISDPLILSFVYEYAEVMQNNILKKIKGGVVIQRIRKHVFVKSESKSQFIETGLSFLSKHGLEANLMSNYYYFNLDEKIRRIDLEEAFIHAIVFSKTQEPDRLLLANYYIKNRSKLNIIELKKNAKKLYVRKELDEIIKIIDNYKRIKEIQ
jgi:predicted transcriptional regulator